MYSNYSPMRSNSTTTTSYYPEEDRFFLAPFLVGGLAGTALGYGLANNQYNSPGYYPIPMYPVYSPYPIYPTYSSNNNYYY